MYMIHDQQPLVWQTFSAGRIDCTGRLCPLQTSPVLLPPR